MLWLIAKYAITAGMVVLISEVAKRSDRLGGLIAALPLVTVLVLIWMKLEGQNCQSRVVHLLVCGADLADVCRLSISLSTPRILADVDRELRTHHLAISTLGHAAQAFWY